MNIQDLFSLGLTGLISLLFKGHSRVFSNTTLWKHHFFGAQPSLWSNSLIHTLLLEKLYLWLWDLEWWLCSTGTAVRRYPTSKGREAPASKMVGTGLAAVQCWSDFEEIPPIQGQRRSPSKTVEGGKSCLESNPTPARDAQRAQTYPVHTRAQRPDRDWDRTVFECLLQRYGSALDCFRARDSGCSKPWYVISPLGRGHQIPHHRVTRIYTGLGNRLLEGTNKILCTPGPRRKEQWPHKRLTQTCPWVSRSLQWRRGSVVACCRVGGTECSMRHFNGGRHYLYYFHHSLASGQITGREYSPAHWQKIKDLLSMAPPIRTRPSFPLSLSHQEASINLLFFSIRG